MIPTARPRPMAARMRVARSTSALGHRVPLSRGPGARDRGYVAAEVDLDPSRRRGSGQPVRDGAKRLFVFLHCKMTRLALRDLARCPLFGRYRG
jgi:hypothetical protein